MARTSGVLAVLIVGCVMMTDPATALLHVVGGSQGWTVPDNETFYQDWAKTRTFSIGDQLIFVYDPGHDNIIRVTNNDFDECHSNNPIEGDFRGPTVLTLNALGDLYYFSMYGLHCKYGQRVHITVVDNNNNNNDNGSSSKQITTRKLQEVVYLTSPRLHQHPDLDPQQPVLP